MASVIEFEKNKVEITGITHNAAYNDVDLSSYIDDDTVGVVIEVTATTSSGSGVVGIRKNGSTDDFKGNHSGEWTKNWIVGVDANNKIEIRSNNSLIKFYIVAYLKDGAELRENAQDISPTTEDSYVDVDITSYLGADAGDVEAAIVIIFAAGIAKQAVSIRKNGSTDSHYYDATYSYPLVCIVGVDSNDVFEIKVEDLDTDLFLVGYIKKDSGLTMLTNSVSSGDKNTTAGWHDWDITSDTASGATGALMMSHHSQAGISSKLVRENGSTNSSSDHDLGDEELRFDMCGLDEDEILEYYIGTSGSNHEDPYRILGYTEETGGTPAADIVKINAIATSGMSKIHGVTKANISKVNGLTI